MKARDRQYIGVLATKEDVSFNREPVFINSLSQIQYTVKSLTLPQQGVNTAIGYISSFSNENDIADDSYGNDEIRINNFTEAVKDKVFVYPFQLQDDGSAKLLNNRANLLPKPSAFSESDNFYPIPVFARKTEESEDWEERNYFRLFRTCRTLDDFIELIKEKKSLGATYGYDATVFTPSFVVWYDNGKFYAVGHVTDNYEASSGGLIVECDKINAIEISSYSNKIIYSPDTNPTLMFVAESAYQAIENRILDARSDLEIQNSDQVNNETVSSKTKNIMDTSTQDRKDEQVFKENKVNMPTPEIDNTNSEDETADTTTVSIAAKLPEEISKTDEGIIQMMDYHSIRSGLHYDLKDLINFHTSIKCGNLVILSGLSGTGKSRIVDMYANAIGIQNSDADKRLLFIPVKPSWNDDSDLLGYVDLVHMVYRPSDSGFVDFLVKAQKEENKNNIYMVCFDEMNLARVEHYFSQFLSLLERPVSQRVLQLYDEQYSGKLYNSKEYPSSINIGENIKFVGTVNIDESTFHFSDKVLDRANVIELNVLDYSKPWNISEKKYTKTLRNPIWTKDDYDRICHSAKEIPEVHAMLWDIHTLLHSTGTKFGVGPRVVRSIDLYLSNIPEGYMDVFSLSEAIDIQIAQRVLTKVRGSENELGDILNNTTEGLESIFNKYNAISSFNRCREIIQQKQKELKAYGYCV
jgi:hypothetical protein